MAETQHLHRVTITRKCGPATLGEDRIRIELWALEEYGDAPAELTRAQAIDVGVALIQAARTGS